MKKATRQQYASAAKARRQKQILAGLGVVLVAVLVIQGPKMLKMFGGSSSTPSTTTTTSTTSSPGTAQPASSAAAPMTVTPTPGLAGAGLAAGPTAGPSGVADASPPRTKSQIYSFELFDSKNPFVQQVTTPTTPSSTATPTPSASVPSSGAAAPTPAPSAPAQPSGGTTATTASYTGSQPQAVSAVSTTTGAALISVNGKSEMVAPGHSFPTANPTFKLVSISNGTALIGLVGGTYASGSATVTLVQGQALTLLDTTDGVRYQLQLDALSAK